MLDLHVWGSALGLPSIDPECLALITYLHNALPSTDWRLVPSNDPSIAPSNLLPALNHDGVWTSGYRPILDYLTSRSLCKDLDADLQSAQQADVVAYSAYLAAHAGPLVDLSLYVSAANWSGATRPAYSKLLRFPLTWTVPPLIRAEAIQRADHLGLAELDRDFDPNGGLHLSAGRDALPETFRRHFPLQIKKTVTEEMTPEQAAAIRIFGLAENCFNDLEALIGDKSQCFKGTHISSLDCLVFAYLALMREPSVPRPFLRDCMQQSSPRLWSYVDEVLSTISRAENKLPLVVPEAIAWSRTITRTVDTVMYHVPTLGEHYAGEVRRRAEKGIKGIDQRVVLLTTSFMLTGMAFSYGFHLYRSLLPFGARLQTWKPSPRGAKLSQFGELGSMLSSAMGPYQPQPSSLGPTSNLGSSRLVETDSDID
ncbi:Metaxin-like protein [Paramyrothecium foliicola]|nr:Metaxin-like protein [Paramyrothecium foliicola]